jgi:hypothetical protein
MSCSGTTRSLYIVLPTRSTLSSDLIATTPESAMNASSTPATARIFERTDRLLNLDIRHRPRVVDRLRPVRRTLPS